MLNAVQNIVANPTFYNLTQSTASQMAIKTSLNSIGRPGFILMDKKIDSHTKKFSATKEFLYQMISLGLYMGLIIPIFKKGSYKLAQKYYNNEAVFKAFNSPSEFKAFKKLKTEAEKISKLQELSSQSKTGDVFTRENITQDSEDLANGVIETSSLAGTILGLAVVAPLAASKLIHPILNGLGLTNAEKAKPNSDDDD